MMERVRSRNACSIGRGQHIHTAMYIHIYISENIPLILYQYLSVMRDHKPVILNVIFLLFTLNGIL